MFKRIAVGISGGVDSAVAALLLKRAKFQVLGVFMRNWDNHYESGFCSDEKDFEDATYVCRTLDIPLYRVNFIKEYWNEVFSVLIKEYESGYTPNPDVLCNRYVKFDSFYKHCRQNLAADAIATGHYANTSFGPYLEHYKEFEEVKLLEAFDKNKCQAFFLSQVKQFSLRRCMFPLANLLKSQVREIAAKEGLIRVADKKDSTGICFVGKRKFQDFIENYIDNKKGVFIDIETGKTIGEHSGIHKWTVGQRCRVQGCTEPYFVIDRDIDTNEIYAVIGKNHKYLWSNICFTDTPHWINKSPKSLEDNNVLHCNFRFTHRRHLMPCKVLVNTNGLTVLLDNCLRAVTPGQYAVFYKNQECIGSARIKSVFLNITF